MRSEFQNQSKNCDISKEYNLISSRRASEGMETMIIEFRMNENSTEAAWLKTLYDLVEELNCKCNTYLEETHNKSFKNYVRTRVIEVFGSATMIGWLKLRMERYNHFINAYSKPEVKIISETEGEPS